MMNDSLSSQTDKIFLLFKNQKLILETDISRFIQSIYDLKSLFGTPNRSSAMSFSSNEPCLNFTQSHKTTLLGCNNF